MQLDLIVRDLVLAVRGALQRPGFTLLVVLTLALGIGVNSAMFTLVDALLFRPLSGRAGNLVGLYSHDPSTPNSYRIFSYPNYADVRDRSDVFESLIAQASAQVGTPDGDITRRTVEERRSDCYGVTLTVSTTRASPSYQPTASPIHRLASTGVCWCGAS